MEKEDGSYSYFTVSIYLSGMGEHTNTEHKPQLDHFMCSVYSCSVLEIFKKAQIESIRLNPKYENLLRT